MWNSVVKLPLSHIMIPSTLGGEGSKFRHKSREYSAAFPKLTQAQFEEAKNGTLTKVTVNNQGCPATLIYMTILPVVLKYKTENCQGGKRLSSVRCQTCRLPYFYRIR